MRAVTMFMFVLLVVAAGCAKRKAQPTAHAANPEAATLAGQWTPGERVATVAAVDGQVMAMRTAATALIEGDAVFANDELTTGPASSVTVVFTVGMVLTIEAQRSVKIGLSLARIQKVSELSGTEFVSWREENEDITAAAARHAEGESADTERTALDIVDIPDRFSRIVRPPDTDAGAGVTWNSRIEVGQLAESKPEVLAVLARGMKRIAACHQAALVTRSVAGKLVVTIAVDPGGRVGEVSFAAAQDDDRLRSCIRDQLAGLQFPAMTGTVELPIELFAEAR